MNPPDYVPPHRFQAVEDGLYRCAYPVLRNFAFLETVAPRTVLSLIPEAPTPDLAALCRAHGIAHHHIAAGRFKGQVQERAVGAALALILTAPRPVVVHCLDGRHVTGHVVLALRKLQGWHPDAALREFARFLVESPKDDERYFLARFAGPLELPALLPPWICGGDVRAAVRASKATSATDGWQPLRLRLPAVLRTQAAAQAAQAAPPAVEQEQRREVLWQTELCVLGLAPGAAPKRRVRSRSVD